MKTLVTKHFGLVLVMMALFAAASSRSYGYTISAWPDTLIMSTAVGTSTDSYVIVSDGRDTLQNLPKGTIHVSLSGSSQFTMITDSVLQFAGYVEVRIRYSPTGSGSSYAKLEIAGDSNSISVPIVGTSVSHFQIQITTGDYDSLYVNQETCENFGVYNMNADTLWVTNVKLTQSGSQWSLQNVASLPTPIPGNASWSVGQLCALWSLSDSEHLHANLTIYYTYGTITDSVTAGVEGYHRPIRTACVTATSGDFGTIAEGTSETKTITLTNATDTSVYLYSPQIVGDSNEFTLNSPSFPIVLPADSSISMSITFSVPSPSTQDNYSATFEASLSGTSPDGIPCTTLYVPLAGSYSIPIVDSITLDVPPGSTSLSILAHTTKSRHAIFIHNADTKRLLIQSLAVEDADTNTEAFFGSLGTTVSNSYDSLSAGATMGPILLTFEAPDTGTYSLDLTLTYETMQAHQKGAVPQSSSYSYTVVAHRLPPISEGVSEPSTPALVDFTLSPNPAHGDVTIGLPNDGSSTVEIYDVLGNLVFQATERGAFVWNSLAGGSPVANGAYIVRVRNGNRISSKRLILSR